MRPDSYHIRSPEALDCYVEQGGTSAINNTKVDGGGKTLATIALVASCIALGAVSMYVILEAQLIDSKIKAGVAAAEQNAREARTTAKVTDDKLIELRDALNAKGMNIPKLDGH